MSDVPKVKNEVFHSLKLVFLRPVAIAVVLYLNALLECNLIDCLRCKILARKETRMPQVQDSQVILTGSVISVVPTTDFADKSPNGAKVTVIAGDGMTIVKLDSNQLRQIAPVTNDRVAWSVRHVPYSVDGSSGMSVKLVRLIDYADIDLLSSTLNIKATAAK